MSARRDQVIAAAVPLLRRDGFANASMRDVAAAVGVTAPALYRHFRSKQALLDATIGSGLNLVEAALRSFRDLDETMAALAVVAVQRNDLWLLVRRESIHLDAPARARVRRRLRAIDAGVGARVATLRPSASADTVQLASRAAVAVLGAPSQYQQRLDRRRLVPLLAHVASRTCAYDPGTTAPEVAPEPVEDPPSSRRDELLDAAAGLIAARGYPNVTLGEIGAAAGMAGPSLYHHFDAKADILVGILRRAVAWIERSQLTAASAARPLDSLLHDYVRLATERPEVFTIFTTETVHLPSDERARVMRAHGRFVDTWVREARRHEPALDAATARLRVTACLCIVNELAPSRRLAATPDFAARLAAIASSTFDGAPGTV